MSNIIGNVAVVVGAGMGGMMAAEVLSKFFAEVIVLEFPHRNPAERSASEPARCKVPESKNRKQTPGHPARSPKRKGSGKKAGLVAV